MTKYRKRPIVIEAVQFWPKNHPWPEGIVAMGHHDANGEQIIKPFIRTLEGDMYISPGDWIITGVNGEQYPCKPDIFEKTYEAVKD